MSTGKIRLWYLIGTLSVGGAERTLVDLANGLDTTQFEVTIWTIAEPGPLVSDVDDHVTVRSLEATGKTDITASLQFGSAVRREQPDILQSFLFYDNTLATLTGLFSPKTTVVTGVRAVPNNPSIPRTLVRHITLRLADHIVSNSQAGAEFIVEHGAKRDDVSVVHNGRNLEGYRNGKATQELYDSLEISPDSSVVGTVGRLIKRKGHYDLLEAWPSILQKHPESKMLIVGNGPEFEGLEKRAQEIGVWDSVCLTGTRDDIPALLDLMDVFVFPSHFEGLPGALLEAMAARLPIVATPVDGNAELIEDGVTGRFVPPHDSEAIADRLTELLDDTDQQNDLGTAASEYAQKEFTIESMVTDFEALYEEVNDAYGMVNK